MTNENWEHFWLNEGFTSFIEAKLVGLLAKDHSEARRFHSALRWQGLQSDIIDFGATKPYTCLVYRLNNVDPDDAYNSSKSFAHLNFLNYNLFFCSTIL